MRHRLRFVAGLLAGCALSSFAHAQYSLTWHTVDGGGGTSSGGAYSISGTIGQPDADIVSMCSPDGGPGCVYPAYELTGGFWGGMRSSACGAGLECIFRDGYESPAI